MVRNEYGKGDLEIANNAGVLNSFGPKIKQQQKNNNKNKHQPQNWLQNHTTTYNKKRKFLSSPMSSYQAMELPEEDQLKITN